MDEVKEHDLLAERFEANRPHLRAVAYRVLGSISEAEDAVQEAWLRFSRTDTSDVDNLRGWLTTVVARVSLDMLRSRRTRREDPIADGSPEPAPHPGDVVDPEHEAVMADSVGRAMLVVLDTLVPAERLAFVLHDMFSVPFDEIAAIIERSTAATRQLASRARRRVQGTAPAPDVDLPRQRLVVDAFLAASRDGQFEALVSLLDPDVVLRADSFAIKAAEAALASGAPAAVLAPEARGADLIANSFSGRARGAQVVLVDGVVGAAFVVNGKPRVVFEFTVEDGQIAELRIIAEPSRVREMEVEILAA